MPGYVIQTNASDDVRRYYVEAPDEGSATSAAAQLLGISPANVSILRTMARWEEEIFPPIINELRPAP